MDDIIDVKMPPPPPEIKENIQMHIQEEALKETPSSDEEDDRPTIPDEEIFPEAPKVKAVKKERSEKQLAHLKKMREAKALKVREKEEWLEEQKQKQKKIVKQEKKKEKKKKKRPPTPDPSSSSEDESSEEEQLVHRVRKENPIFHKLTAGEIRAIQRDAIQDYDMIRKSRKMKKEEHYKRMAEEHDLRQGMHQMSQPDNDPWSSAFNFS